jgi:hypothetical protein
VGIKNGSDGMENNLVVSQTLKQTNAFITQQLFHSHDLK